MRVFIDELPITPNIIELIELQKQELKKQQEHDLSIQYEILHKLITEVLQKITPLVKIPDDYFSADDAKDFGADGSGEIQPHRENTQNTEASITGSETQSIHSDSMDSFL